MTDPDWAEAGLCRQVDPDLWFPPRGAAGREAKALCVLCPSREPCLEYALAYEAEHGGLYGVWGGTTQQERERMRGLRGGEAA